MITLRQMRRRPFAKWERAYLRRFYETRTWEQLAIGMTRCVGSVRYLATEMGLGEKPRCGMTEVEAVMSRRDRRGGHRPVGEHGGLYRCQDCCQLTRVGPACGCAPERRSA